MKSLVKINTLLIVGVFLLVSCQPKSVEVPDVGNKGKNPTAGGTSPGPGKPGGPVDPLNPGTTVSVSGSVDGSKISTALGSGAKNLTQTFYISGKTKGSPVPISTLAGLISLGQISNVTPGEVTFVVEISDSTGVRLNGSKKITVSKTNTSVLFDTMSPGPAPAPSSPPNGGGGGGGTSPSNPPNGGSGGGSGGDADIGIDIGFGMWKGDSNIGTSNHPIESN